MPMHSKTCEDFLKLDGGNCPFGIEHNGSGEEFDERQTCGEWRKVRSNHDMVTFILLHLKNISMTSAEFETQKLGLESGHVYAA